MITDTISRESARRFYDWLGARHDQAEMYESRVKQRALELLALEPGQWVLNVGVGTGKELRQIQTAVAPSGAAYGTDLSPVMLDLARTRAAGPLCRADAVRLPFADASFDRLFSSYVLDLLPLADLPDLLADFKRVLRPGGRLALVALTEGMTPVSRAIVDMWKLAYAISPVACGGCRPLQLAALVCQAGFVQVKREAVVQFGVPSEVVVATH